MEVGYFEGSAEFALPVRVAPGAAAGPQKVLVSVSYQTCNDRMCLPPRTVKLELPAEIAGRGTKNR